MNLEPLKTAPRLLLKATLQPLQGTRFQPTGFPDLGAATYDAVDKEGRTKKMLLVESAQSMANRLEAVCWDDANSRPIQELSGLPYVEAILPDGTKTNSLLEAHRLNSPYIVNSLEFDVIEKEIGFVKNKPFDRLKLARALFKYDPCSLLHGIFLEKIGGVVRLPRALSAFIEAVDVTVAANGGVKFDRIQPETTGKVTPYGKAEDGYGNVPYPREDYCGAITAFFNLDLALLRGFGLSESAIKLLVDLALYKIHRFLEIGLRLRTACDLDLVAINVTRPTDIGDTQINSAEIAKRLKASIEANKETFGPSPLVVHYDTKVAKAKKAAKEKQNKVEKDADETDDGEATS